MNITQQDLYFWSTLENDLSINVANHIKNGFHMCGFSNALAFKNIDDDDIKYVENFIKTKLLDRVNGAVKQAAEAGNVAGQDEGIPIDKIDYVHFFGNYARAHTEFQFERGEQKLIKELIMHVKRIVDDFGGENKGLHHFNLKDTAANKRRKFVWKNIICYPHGRIFGTATTSRGTSSLAEIQVGNPLTTQSIEVLKTNLLSRIKQVLVSFDGLDENVVGKINEKILSVNITRNTMNEIVIKGSIDCIFCVEKGVEKKISMYYQNATSSKYWVVSNFKKHLEIHCEFHLKKEDRPIKKKKINVGTSLKNSAILDIDLGSNNVPLESTIDKDTTTKQVNKESDETKPEIVVHGVISTNSGINEHDTEIKSELSKQDECFIEYIDDLINQTEDLLHTQMCDQNSKIISATLIHSEVTVDVKFNLSINGAVSSIKCAEIDKDGNCLFSALAHQLFYKKITSAEHKRLTNNLRFEVAEYIQQNLSSFERDIKGRLYETEGMTKSADFQKDCTFFVNYCLKRNGFWGGSETLHAVSRMYEVNIIIFNENGPVYVLNDLSLGYKRSVALAFRCSASKNKSSNSEGESNVNRNHYDSVCEIKDIYNCMQILLTLFKKSYINKKSSKSIVSL